MSLSVPGYNWLVANGKTPKFVDGLWRWISEDPPGKSRPSAHELHHDIFQFLNGNGAFPWQYGNRVAAIEDAAQAVMLWQFKRDSMFLDCYFYGAMLGDQFPVNSYGPALRKDLEGLADRVGHNFDRMEYVKQTKGQNPLPPEFWPGIDRPR